LEKKVHQKKTAKERRRIIDIKHWLKSIGLNKVPIEIVRELFIWNKANYKMKLKLPKNLRYRRSP
jgi:hypothetical protein